MTNKHAQLLNFLVELMHSKGDGIVMIFSRNTVTVSERFDNDTPGSF